MSMEGYVSEYGAVKEQDRSMLLHLRSSYQNAEHHRTSIKRWMSDNYDGFSATLEVMFPGQIDWVWLTSWFQENGFRNRDGSDLKKETVRKVWSRVVSSKLRAGG